jgi:hypothetical protein
MLAYMGENNVIEVRKLLLDFYASELTTHSRLIIGFSVMMFTILQIAQKLEENSPLTDNQVWISAFGIWLTAVALWYLIMRHLTYGALSGAVIDTPIAENKSYDDVKAEIVKYALRYKILVFFPCYLFISIRPTRRRMFLLFGLIICAILGTVTALLLSILIGLI